MLKNYNQFIFYKYIYYLNKISKKFLLILYIIYYNLTFIFHYEQKY